MVQLSSGVTNSDGRTDAPLLLGDALKTGTYRIAFQVGGYYAAKGVQLPEPAFLDEVILQVNLLAERVITFLF